MHLDDESPKWVREESLEEVDAASTGQIERDHATMFGADSGLHKAEFSTTSAFGVAMYGSCPRSSRPFLQVGRDSRRWQTTPNGRSWVRLMDEMRQKGINVDVLEPDALEAAANEHLMGVRDAALANAPARSGDGPLSGSDMRGIVCEAQMV